MAGRGELYLILIETMWREAYELAVSKPNVIMKEINRIQHEPLERVTVDVGQNNGAAVEGWEYVKVSYKA